MEWISVKDRLPEESMHVLIYTEFWQIEQASYYQADDLTKHFWIHNQVVDYKTTHWMPLPSPPKV